MRESSEDEGSETEADSSPPPTQPAFEIVGTSSDSPEQEAKRRDFPFKQYRVSLARTSVITRCDSRCVFQMQRLTSLLL